MFKTTLHIGTQVLWNALIMVHMKQDLHWTQFPKLLDEKTFPRRCFSNKMLYCHHFSVWFLSQHCYSGNGDWGIWLELFIDGAGRAGSVALTVSHQSQASCADTGPRPHECLRGAWTSHSHLSVGVPSTTLPFPYSLNLPTLQLDDTVD